MGHGGSRKGAGRPTQYGSKTLPMRVPCTMVNSIQKFIQYKGYQLPLFGSKVPAGFPSPADDYIVDTLDLNDFLVKHPEATFLVRVSGESMRDASINENDVLIVDRNLPVQENKIVVASIDGLLTVKRLHKNKQGKFVLMPENPDFEPIEVSEESDVCIWGVVSYVIHQV